MTTDTKVIILTVAATGAILVGALVFLSRNTARGVPSEDVVASNGLHWHPNLTIMIDGKKQELSPNIGIGAIHQKIHTHEDADKGIIHMEMQGVVTKQDTKLGNFFRIWGKEFSSVKIFDKTNSSEKNVKVTVNGKDNKDFENYLMRDGDKIEIRYE